MRSKKLCVSFVCAAVFVCHLRVGIAQEIFIRAKVIHTVSGDELRDAMIVVSDGKITGVGPRLTPPAEARVLEASVVIPGFIDAHTHVALDRSSRPPGPVTAEWRAVDHVNLEDPMLETALSGGMTSLTTRPGSGIVSSGQGVALKLRGASGPSRVLKAFVDLKMAVRPLINLRDGEEPATVMGWFAIADEYFRRARDYLENDESGDPRLDAFAAVLRGDAMLHVHSHYPSEIQAVLRLARKYGFTDNLALSHAQESFPIAELVADAGIVVVVGPVFLGRYFSADRTHHVVKELMDAGVTVSVQTDQAGAQLRDFREYGAFLVRHGLDEADALRALTLNGAKAMMLADRIGSIEVGKDADLVLLDGSPFDLTRDPIRHVIVDGVVEYSQSQARTSQMHELTRVGPITSRRGEIPSGPSFNLVNAHLFTVSHGTIRGGTIVVENGKITRLGRQSAIRALPTLDVGGRVVMPGFISGRAYPNDWTGDLKWQVQNDETTDRVAPEMNARFAIDPWFPSFEVLREVGLTSQQVTPGHANPVGGSGVVIKTAGVDLEQMVRREPSSVVFAIEDDGEPIRVLLGRARDYLEQSSPSFDVKLESLRPLLSRKVPAIMQASTSAQIRTALNIAEEFSLRLVLSGAVEAHRMAGELANANVSVILGDTASRLEALRGGGDGYEVRAPAILSASGVRVAFYGPSGARRGMPTGRLGGEPALNAAWAYRNGASEDEALRMVSLNAAEIFDMGDTLGSLDVGKDADLVVIDAHPFDYRATPELVYIDGNLVYNKHSQ